jgi:hypothetical protein
MHLTATFMDRKMSVVLGAAVLVFVWLLGAGARPIGAQETPEYIYGCKVLSTSLLRIVSGPGTCTPVLESEISWRTGPVDGTELPFSCITCDLRWYGATFFRGKKLDWAYIQSSSVQDMDFTSTSFRNANASYMPWSGADLTGADFTNANLVWGEGMEQATRTSIIWGNTICPNGENSNDNSGTCEGNLNPYE